MRGKTKVVMQIAAKLSDFAASDLRELNALLDDVPRWRQGLRTLITVGKQINQAERAGVVGEPKVSL
jgi:hypothetical protein